ncbi:MAG: hypothetical protein K2W96_15675 [Gemmataceae bacterium]|nr:hypothetical protein [Gemmataceae bacterium]
MKTILKTGQLVLVPEDAAEESLLAAWKGAMAGHVLHVHATTGTGAALFDLGPKEAACNEPINIGSRVAEPRLRLISNFAATPFVLDGEEYASVEGFWQGLKFETRAERRRVAALAGGEAREAGAEKGYGETVEYAGERIPVGTWKHWALMERACRAKFEQDEATREALLSTGERPLTHRMRRDSRSIPGAIMAEIWMGIRRDLGA